MDKKPVPNLALYFQLQPNVSRLAKDAGISRPTIYAMVYAERTSDPETIQKFNSALSRLLKERMEMAKNLSKPA